MNTNERYEKGRQLFEKLHGKHAGEMIVNSVADICPDLERFTMEWGFHDIMSRHDKLDLKTRELAIIASLVTLGGLPDHLNAHIEAALNVGVKKEEIVEIILQLGLYAGFPKASSAMMSSKALLKR